MKYGAYASEQYHISTVISGHIVVTWENFLVLRRYRLMYVRKNVVMVAPNSETVQKNICEHLWKHSLERFV